MVILIKYRDEQTADYILKSVLLIIPAILTAAAGYVINDIFDVNTDKINKPDDCIVGVSMSRKNAVILYIILNLISLMISYLFSMQYAVFNVCIIALLYLYSMQLKSIPLIGNMIVAMCSAAVIACCVLLIGFETNAGIMNFTGYIVFSFLISLIRELVKDMQDMEGDLAAGIKTYPIVAGVKGAKIMIYVISGIEIILCGLYSFLSWGLDMYAASIIMGLITFSLLYFINHLARTRNREEYGASSKLLKFIMLAGVINLIFA